MGKMYVTDVPKWAQVILPDMENDAILQDSAESNQMTRLFDLCYINKGCPGTAFVA